MFRYFFLLFFSCTLLNASAQENLIEDPSFEQQIHSLTWDKLRIEQNLLHWKDAASGEIMYIHKKHRIAKPAQNVFGKQEARTGEGLVAFKLLGRIYSATSGDIRRYYLQTKLKHALVAGKKYRLSYFVSHGELSSLAVSFKDFQALFCKEEFPRLDVNASENRRIYHTNISKTGEAIDIGRAYASLWLKNTADTIVSDKANWTEVAFEFTANGGEKILYIGNFEIIGKEKTKVIPSKLRFYWYDAYYFIDDVNLTEVVENEEVIAKRTIEDSLLTSEKLNNYFSLNKEIVLPTVNFEFNSAKLLPEAKKSLDTVVAYLKNNPDVALEFLGYTDNVGDSLNNLQLSVQRAKNVADCICSFGISKERVRFCGFGASFPLVPNNTPASRKRNRRVTVRRRKESE